MSLAHVSEALSLVGVPFIEFGFGMDARAREHGVTTFETSDKTRVLLMGLKVCSWHLLVFVQLLTSNYQQHGSRGLNLISASRIIFCEPVFDRDVEAQAIKV